MPASDILSTWTTIAEGLAYYGISAQEWAVVAKALGDEHLDDLGTLASIEADDYKEARNTVKLTPIKKGAFNLLFGAVKLKFGFATNLVQQIS